MSLIEKVSPFQNQTVRHLELLEAFSELQEELVQSEIKRFSKAISIFSADSTDIDRKLQDSGNLIYFLLPSPEHRRLIYLWEQELRLHKNETLSIEILFQQAGYYGNSVSLEPLYAPKNQDYGSLFVEIEDLPLYSLTESEVFMTSYTAVGVRYQDFVKINVDVLEFQSLVEELFEIIRPIQIGYSGFLLKEFDESDLWIPSYQIEETQEISNRPDSDEWLIHQIIEPLAFIQKLSDTQWLIEYTDDDSQVNLFYWWDWITRQTETQRNYEFSGINDYPNVVDCYQIEETHYID